MDSAPKGSKNLAEFPFKQGVRGSNPRWVTKTKHRLLAVFYFAHVWMRTLGFDLLPLGGFAA